MSLQLTQKQARAAVRGARMPLVKRLEAIFADGRERTAADIKVALERDGGIDPDLWVTLKEMVRAQRLTSDKISDVTIYRRAP